MKTMRKIDILVIDITGIKKQRRGLLATDKESPERYSYLQLNKNGFKLVLFSFSLAYIVLA